MKSSTARRCLVFAAVVLTFTSTGRGQTTPTLTTLYPFPDSGVYGSSPDSSLALGSDGNFYGTTRYGGGNKVGTVFSLTPAGVLTILHTFTGSIATKPPPTKGLRKAAVVNTDGARPNAGLVLGSDGNFYGTTAYGGADDYGTVFKMTPAGQLTTLYSFTGGDDGAEPSSKLAEGGDGNFYGTTEKGSGSSETGTVFSISPGGDFTTVYTFTGTGAGALVLGNDGNLYGTTSHGGNGDVGTVFSITPAGTPTTLHSFSRSTDGAYPNALVLGSDGKFYGTASYGGSSDLGTVFSITPAGVFTPLYSFTGGTDGTYPEVALVQGSDGTFYGTASEGGSASFGTVFSITPAGVLTTLHSFTGGTDGADPYAALIQGSNGDFYGTTAGGDSGDNGTVFELTVSTAVTHPPFFTGEEPLTDGVYYLAFANGNDFGYYEYLPNPNYIYHFDLGFEYVFDANDGESGVYFYDFTSSDFFYTSPNFPFPFLYDFGLDSVVYYYPDPNNPGHYNTNGIRYFYVFSTGDIISK